MTNAEIAALAEELEARHRDTWPLQIGQGSLINEDGPRAAAALRAWAVEREVMRGALEAAAAQFRRYEALHAAKARTNAEFAAACEAALTPKEPNNGH